MSRERFDLESPNFTRTSPPTYAIATPDMTSPTTSGRHLSKLKKTAENPASDIFGSNFSGAAFCLAHINWWASCSNRVYVYMCVVLTSCRIHDTQYTRLLGYMIFSRHSCQNIPHTVQAATSLHACYTLHTFGL